MRTDRHDDRGFTLIELLVVIIIIGILAAIAIPTFLAQKQKAHRASALADMKNAAVALETYATDNNGSYAGLNGATHLTPALTAEGFRSSEWVSLGVVATTNSYCLVGVNTQVPGKQFVLRSDGGIVQILLQGSPSC